MSRIYFHSEDGEAIVHGSERAYMGVFCSDLMSMVLGLNDKFFEPEWLYQFLPPEARTRSARDISTWLHVGGHFLVDGQKEDAFTVSLNTALAAGSDAVKLMARLHGQCEVHCWLEGKHRAWLADIIDKGRGEHLLRPNQGWEATSTFLRKDESLPVVCSYSVCEQFPNFGMLPADHPLQQQDDNAQVDEFYDIPKTEQWSLCFGELKRRHEGLQLKPSDWADIRFGTGHSAFSIREIGQSRQKTAAAGEAQL